jgi:hypothetical protein
MHNCSKKVWSVLIFIRTWCWWHLTCQYKNQLSLGECHWFINL